MKRDETNAEVVKNTADGEVVQIWCVCDSLLDVVESYHPSYAWAMDRIAREADSRPVTMQAMVRESKAVFRGQSFRVVMSTWDRYGATLLVAGNCPDLPSREMLVHQTALNTGRSRRKVRVDMRRRKVQCRPQRHLPAHALDVPELVTISPDDYRHGPVFSRHEALELAANENRRALAQAASWGGHWCLVVELSDPLPLTWVSPEFAGPLGIESLVLRRAVRLVHPTTEEIERFAQG